MKVNRVELLAALEEAKIGLSTKENLEQSNCYVFVGENLITFNDEILVRAKSPLDFDAVLTAADLVKVIEKFPDDELDVTRKENELVIKGNRRSAGITCQAEVRLPFDAVPKPDKWVKLTEGTGAMLQQAARTCGTDETQFLTTVVHIKPDRIEACDNYRLFRADGPTGFTDEVLIPASGLGGLGKLPIIRACQGKGWTHFRLESGTAVSVRCSHEKYHEGVDTLLDVKDGEEVSLPGNLEEIVGRAQVMNESGYDSRVSVAIAEGEIVVTARKETGWYKERKKVTYRGPALNFDINPEFFVALLSRTTDVTIGSGRLLIAVDNIQCVVALTVAKADAEEEPAEPKE